MSRQVPEWIGKTDDEAIPPRVKLRVFNRANGRCQNCTLKIVGKLRPEYDHRTALVSEGEHREGNLQLLCVPCHEVKTKSDVAEKSQMYHKRVKAVGIKRKRWTIGGRKFDGTPVPPKWK